MLKKQKDSIVKGKKQKDSSQLSIVNEDFGGLELRYQRSAGNGGNHRMQKKTESSNYEKMKNNMAAVFLQYDQETMIRRFALEQDADSLFLTF